MKRSSSMGLVLLGILTVASPPLANAGTLIGLNPDSSGTNVLDIQSSPFSFSINGKATPNALSGLDFQPGTLELFASQGHAGGAGGNLYTLNRKTGLATLVGATGFAAVPGLTFDPFTGVLYGSADFDPVGSGLLLSDGLITIVPGTGVGTKVGTGYGTSGGNPISGLDAIAVSPIDGTLYGVSGFGFDGTPGDVFTISKATGLATKIGDLSTPATVAGLGFDPSGNLFGSFGGTFPTSQPGDERGIVVSIDLNTFTFSVLGDIGDGAVSDIAVVVPEPGSLALFVLGVFALCLLDLERNRRGKAAVRGERTVQL